ncbi:MAG: OB-fold domain-containing protein [Rhodospirillaceae bacterium]|nr:OB-fold domain-containing protein [Rhodospirillaceae bacterium]MDD9929453.1 OB-fold domain-containing protein [Rhodospirillaceae bacterium]
MSQRNIPSPPMSVENEAFWAAANEGKLMIPRCKDTGQFFWYPRNLSPFTLSNNVEMVEASGKGTIYTYSVMRRADPQYVIAYVTLEEGITMMTNIVDCDYDTVAVGQAVELDFYETENGQKVPVFKPAG